MRRAVYVCGDVIGGPGGAGQVTLNEVKALGEAGFGEVELIHGGGASLITPLVYQGLGVPFIQDYFALARLRSLLKKGPIDHAHFYSNGFAESVLYLKEHGIPVTYTSPAHDRIESIKEWERVTGKVRADFPYPHISEDALFTQHNAGLLAADLVIASSGVSKKVVQEMGRSGPIDIIPHGIDYPETIGPRVSAKTFVVGYLGAYGPDKGVSYLLKAWDHLGYADAELLLGGLGTDTEEFETWTRGQVGKQGNRVRMAGKVTSASEVYLRSDVYCAPSVTEGFGITIIEAMAYGCPVITTQGAGASEWVRHGVDGWVVGPRQYLDIAYYIDYLKKHPEEREEMGKQARERARMFDWPLVRAAYVRAFLELHPEMTSSQSI